MEDVRVGDPGVDVPVALQGADAAAVAGHGEAVVLVARPRTGGRLLGVGHASGDRADDVAGTGVAHDAAVGAVVRTGAVVGVRGGGTDTDEEERPEGGDGGGCADAGQAGLLDRKRECGAVRSGRPGAPLPDVARSAFTSAVDELHQRVAFPSIVGDRSIRS
ncbi:hypothetical protein ACIGXI_20215 [Kitasatospora aureofaciens]|uniref:hypothetical protein n=1 Tax=Kitasatospora aureofaciens TaxID=1894 RepID=UPI0037C8BFB9